MFCKGGPFKIWFQLLLLWRNGLASRMSEPWRWCANIHGPFLFLWIPPSLSYTLPGVCYISLYGKSQWFSCYEEIWSFYNFTKKKPEKKGKQTNLASKHLSLFSSEKNRCRKRFLPRKSFGGTGHHLLQRSYLSCWEVLDWWVVTFSCLEWYLIPCNFGSGFLKQTFGEDTSNCKVMP